MSERARDRAVANVRTLITASRLGDARAACDAALDRYADPALYALLGYIAQQTRDNEAAAQACELAVRLGLRDWSNFLVWGRSLAALLRHREAADAFASALELAPQRDDVAVGLLEQTYAAYGIAVSAERYTALRIGSDSPALTRTWARLAFEDGSRDFAAAVPGVVVSPRTSVRDWLEKKGAAVMWAGTVDESPVVFPPVVGIEQQTFTRSVPSNQPYLAELADARIFYQSSVILASDGAALDDLGTHARFGRFVSYAADGAVIGQRDDMLLLEAGNVQFDEIEAGIMLCGAASNQFGHWVCDLLPRLQVYERHPEFTQLPIIVDDDMPVSHYEYLACIASNPLIRIKRGRGARCRRLIVAGPLTFFPVHMRPHPFRSDELVSLLPASRRYLKQRVEERLGVEAQRGDRIFLSRKNMTWRRLSNDLEIAAYLELRGYRTVDVETLTFPEQVRQFQRASSIVAAHGAALLNVIFADPSVELVVLSSPDLHDLPCFYGQVSPLGYEAVFVCGEALGDPSEKHADYRIPLDTLESGLRFIVHRHS